MRRLETERLILNNFYEEDIESFIILINDYIKSEYSKFDHKWPESRSEIKKVMHWFSSNDNYLAVRIKNRSDVIGFVNLTQEEVGKPKTYSIGYVFNSKYQGNGYAYEACSAYIQYAINELGVDEIITGTAKENIKSCILLNRLGFQKIEEKKVNFIKSNDDKAIEFIGCTYKLVDK